MHRVIAIATEYHTVIQTSNARHRYTVSPGDLHRLLTIKLREKKTGLHNTFAGGSSYLCFREEKKLSPMVSVTSFK